MTSPPRQLVPGAFFGRTERELRTPSFEFAERIALVPDRTTPRWLLRARDELHDRCTDKVTVAQLAREAQVHPIHLARVFRQYFHCSPGQYLRRCRIDRLSELLRSSELPLSEVALEAGFSDQSQMTTACRRATGLTPRDYRRTFRDGEDVSFSQDAARR